MNLFNTYQKYHKVFEHGPNQTSRTSIQDAKQKSVEIFHPFAEFKGEIPPLTIKKFEENDIDFIIKNKTISVKNLKTIPDKLFYCCSSLTSITIPSSVTSIGKYAFVGCNSLTSIDIPSSVTSIGKYAFCGCSGIKKITLPKRFETRLSKLGIPNQAKALFEHGPNQISRTSIQGSKQKSVDIFYPFAEFNDEIPSEIIEKFEEKGIDFKIDNEIDDKTILVRNLKTIPKELFYRCSCLTSVFIPSSVKSISQQMFKECKNLMNVVIPSSVTSIGNYAFSHCSRLTNITIPSSVTSIGDNAFCCCCRLTSIDIPSSVMSIGGAAFYGCTSLTNVVIPSSVTSIGTSVFADCWGLTSVVIPSSVTRIGVDAFAGCTSLTNVEIPSSVTSIGANAFAGCESLTSVEIPSLVMSIGRDAFYYCSELKKITLPKRFESKLKELGLDNIPKTLFETGINQTSNTDINDIKEREIHFLEKNVKEYIQEHGQKSKYSDAGLYVKHMLIPKDINFENRLDVYSHRFHIPKKDLLFLKINFEDETVHETNILSDKTYFIYSLCFDEKNPELSVWLEFVSPDDTKGESVYVSGYPEPKNTLPLSLIKRCDPKLYKKIIWRAFQFIQDKSLNESNPNQIQQKTSDSIKKDSTVFEIPDIEFLPLIQKLTREIYINSEDLEERDGPNGKYYPHLRMYKIFRCLNKLNKSVVYLDIENTQSGKFNIVFHGHALMKPYGNIYIGKRNYTIWRGEPFPETKQIFLDHYDNVSQVWDQKEYIFEPNSESVDFILRFAKFVKNYPFEGTENPKISIIKCVDEFYQNQELNERISSQIQSSNIEKIHSDALSVIQLNPLDRCLAILCALCKNKKEKRYEFNYLRGFPRFHPNKEYNPDDEAERGKFAMEICGILYMPEHPETFGVATRCGGVYQDVNGHFQSCWMGSSDTVRWDYTTQEFVTNRCYNFVGSKPNEVDARNLPQGILELIAKYLHRLFNHIDDLNQDHFIKHFLEYAQPYSMRRLLKPKEGRRQSLIDALMTKSGKPKKGIEGKWVNYLKEKFSIQPIVIESNRNQIQASGENIANDAIRKAQTPWMQLQKYLGKFDLWKHNGYDDEDYELNDVEEEEAIETYKEENDILDDSGYVDDDYQLSPDEHAQAVKNWIDSHRWDEVQSRFADWIEDDWDDFLNGDYSYLRQLEKGPKSSKYQEVCWFDIKSHYSSNYPSDVYNDIVEDVIQENLDNRGGYDDQYIYIWQGAFNVNGQTFVAVHPNIIEQANETCPEWQYFKDHVYEYIDEFYETNPEILKMETHEQIKFLFEHQIIDPIICTDKENLTFGFSSDVIRFD